MCAIVNAADLHLIEGMRWHWSPGSYGRGMKGGSVVLGMDVSPKPTLARIIMNVTDPDLQVSHINGDKLDCRRANLIVRTRSEVKRAAKRPRKWEGLVPYPTRIALASYGCRS